MRRSKRLWDKLLVYSRTDLCGGRLETAVTTAIKLSYPYGTAAMKPISNLAALKLTEIKEELEKASKNEQYDAYTRAHLVDSLTRVTKWLESRYVVRAD